MKKKLIKIMALCFAVCVLFCACDTNNGNITETTNQPETTEAIAEETAETGETVEKEAVRLAVLKGPTGMGAAQVLTNNEKGEAANDYTVTIASSPDELVAEIVAGRFDIAAVPTNLAATLYQKTEGNVKVAALNTLGVLYILENGTTINSIKDLEGKTIGATGQGSTPEYVLNYILEANGLKNGENITVEYYSEHAELVTQMVSGNVDIGMLPQPNVQTALTKNGDLRIALNLTEEWDKLNNGSQLTQGCIVVSKDFAENHADALSKFMTEYEASVKFVNENPSEASVMIETLGIIPSAAIAEKAIPSCNITFIKGEEMKTILSGFLEVLYNANPKAVGGALPADDFYII